MQSVIVTLVLDFSFFQLCKVGGERLVHCNQHLADLPAPQLVVLGVRGLFVQLLVVVVRPVWILVIHRPLNKSHVGLLHLTFSHHHGPTYTARDGRQRLIRLRFIQLLNGSIQGINGLLALLLGGFVVLHLLRPVTLQLLDVLAELRDLRLNASALICELDAPAVQLSNVVLLLCNGAFSTCDRGPLLLLHFCAPASVLVEGLLFLLTLVLQLLREVTQQVADPGDRVGLQTEGRPAQG
mmetsp:Transcript_58603/g.132588  ORF Transcript_58603/g.132588 Transcript_58603/m.132588 type:complete len:239 (-) Transcript_58603:141-857(-)